MLSPWFYFVGTNPFERGIPATPLLPPVHKTPQVHWTLILRFPDGFLVFPAASRCAENIATAKFGR
ncbi:hypothetical protein N9062_04295 [Akkermansiaceae bacterium]|nr:hypothetical protein [bacterium]MDA7934331.1 hypothetical protein [Akkermansiaceae bacterium]MDB4510207.1 hypothetical protein [Akkermansiaceae bacterium]